MAQERGGEDRERSAGVRLARLLRRWWEEAGSSAGGTRPTQQALAARLGVDQTTLSRYLNPMHLSTAPLRVVESLHTQLRAPAAELEQARALCRAALRENSRRRAADGAGEQGVAAGRANGSDELPAPGAVPGEAPRTVPGEGTDAAVARGGASGRLRTRWLRPTLLAAAIVLAFSSGMVVNDRLSTPDREATVAAAAGAAPASEPSYEWPLLYMDGQDQYTRARALQYLLNAYGYKVRTDGFFREDTRDAVMDFQRRKFLPVDGKVGKLTWPELVREVGPGSKPFEVRAVQELLNNVGLGGTSVSGKFTAVTAEDVRYFQHRYGMPETGRVDVDTWLALLVNQLPPVKAPEYQRATSPLPSASD
ncbi:peptidoglycan-binding protein [Streptomyces sp. RY43-2]|uniref:Peptidoglycan-binding protein n=1 Tax=Streptomyces macrolidinus TaxID=2952607 RepID=A0ABT0Z9I0_9ACTN|nr:peptidoglycan-binding protein [Streptomyces macrolidinus]MCN9240410.1 peptidoglycan-binding protein [Streptomyces macrolidinus]